MSIGDFFPWRRSDDATAGTPGGSPLHRLQRDMNELFESFVRNPIGQAVAGASTSRFVPAVDVVETATSFDVTAELPGVAEDAVELDLTDEHLTIRGEKVSILAEAEEDGYRRVERSYGTFERKLMLPGEVNADGVTASFSHGLLRVTLPKTTPEKKTSRKIQIQSQPPGE